MNKSRYGKPMSVISISIPSTLLESIDTLANEKGVSRSQYILSMMGFTIKDEEKKTPKGKAMHNFSKKRIERQKLRLEMGLDKKRRLQK